MDSLWERILDGWDEVVDWWNDRGPASLKSLIVPLLLVLGLWWGFSDPDVTRGPDPEDARAVVILMHGYGTGKDDLAPLAEELLKAAPDVSFILPNAPHRVQVFGRAWFPLFSAPSKAEYETRLAEYRVEAREIPLDLIEDLVDDDVPPERIYVGGFSQGAGVALDVILSEAIGPELGGLLFLSGAATDLDISPLAERPPRRTFVSHGTQDRMVSSVRAKELVKLLEDNDFPVEFVEFPDGHGVAPLAVTRLGEFLLDSP